MGDETHCANRGILDGPSYPRSGVRRECFSKIDLGNNRETYVLMVSHTVKNDESTEIYRNGEAARGHS